MLEDAASSDDRAEHGGGSDRRQMKDRPPSEVVVKIPRAMSALADGDRLIRVLGRTVGEVLSALEERHPSLRSVLRDQSGQLRRHILIFVDSQDIRAQNGEQTAVSGDSELAILSAIEGG
jgi:molybdopterin converting factor small subunit